MKIDSLPAQYRPYKEIDIGTNRLVGGQVLFSINENAPVLIGANGVPRVWLSIPADARGETWQPLVRDNKSLHPKVTVKIKGESVIIDTPDGVVLRVRKENENLVRVNQINLRPFGINIYGNEQSLTVMNSNLARNMFVGVRVMVEIGSEKKMPNKSVEKDAP